MRVVACFRDAACDKLEVYEMGEGVFQLVYIPRYSKAIASRTIQGTLDEVLAPIVEKGWVRHACPPPAQSNEARRLDVDEDFKPGDEMDRAIPRPRRY